MSGDHVTGAEFDCEGLTPGKADVNVFEDDEQNAATTRTESNDAERETANFAPSCECFFLFINFL